MHCEQTILCVKTHNVKMLIILIVVFVVENCCCYLFDVHIVCHVSSTFLCLIDVPLVTYVH